MLWPDTKVRESFRLINPQGIAEEFNHNFRWQSGGSYISVIHHVHMVHIIKYIYVPLNMQGDVSGECSHGGCVAVWEDSGGDCESFEIDGSVWEREGGHDTVVCDKTFEWSPPNMI